MKIFLIRHAHAVDGKDDALRPLSAKGRRQCRAMGAYLKRRRLLGTREFWHSPLVRAVDTAKRFALALGGKAKQLPVDGLLHDDDPAIMARQLQRVRRPVAVVGHEPHLSALATRLLAGRDRPPIIALKKGAVLALERAGRRWAVRWLISPKEI